MELVEQKINQLALFGHSNSNRINQAISYSLLSGGKRIRPLLVLLVSRIFTNNIESALNLSIIFEVIHTYSLIHDDLPAIDNDDVRRNQPSCHKKFDEATAILAGDGLLTMAFELLVNNNIHSNAEVKCNIIDIIAKAIGNLGMIKGQMLDILANNKRLSCKELIKIASLKTARLFASAAESSAVLQNASSESVYELRKYGHKLGIAFQIKDDIVDQQQDQKLLNIEYQNLDIQDIANKALNHLTIFGDKAENLRRFTYLTLGINN